MIDDFMEVEFFELLCVRRCSIRVWRDRDSVLLKKVEASALKAAEGMVPRRSPVLV